MWIRPSFHQRTRACFMVFEGDEAGDLLEGARDWNVHGFLAKLRSAVIFVELVL